MKEAVKGLGGGVFSFFLIPLVSLPLLPSLCRYVYITLSPPDPGQSHKWESGNIYLRMCTHRMHT